MLLIVSDNGDSYQYPFFVRDGIGCRYVGHVDAEDKFKPPRYRIIPRTSSGIWFVLSDYAGSGTGFYREMEEW